MILKELKISNFRSYYKESLFTFKDGLTLIIGGNGDGKTTFFDALDWLFSTDKDNKDVGLISEKRKS
ncbi:MAG: AAA family ATPase, partial [Phocaeicola sp.]